MTLRVEWLGHHLHLVKLIAIVSKINRSEPKSGKSNNNPTEIKSQTMLNLNQKRRALTRSIRIKEK